MPTNILALQFALSSTEHGAPGANIVRCSRVVRSEAVQGHCAAGAEAAPEVRGEGHDRPPATAHTSPHTTTNVQ